MKKLFLFLMMMVGTLAAHAEDYTYLTFETTDGAKVSVSVSSLTITISGTTLMAGEKSFTLSNLSKMYFSASNETTGISEELRVESEESATAIYDLNGRKVQNNQMRSGQVYIVKTKSGTHKIAVK